MTTPDELASAPCSEGGEQEVNEIIAQTDWTEYWQAVSAEVEEDVEAYETARARSLMAAARRVLV